MTTTATTTTTTDESVDVDDDDEELRRAFAASLGLASGIERTTATVVIELLFECSVRHLIESSSSSTVTVTSTTHATSTQPTETATATTLTTSTTTTPTTRVQSTIYGSFAALRANDESIGNVAASTTTTTTATTTTTTTSVLAKLRLDDVDWMRSLMVGLRLLDALDDNDSSVGVSNNNDGNDANSDSTSSASSSSSSPPSMFNAAVGAVWRNALEKGDGGMSHRFLMLVLFVCDTDVFFFSVCVQI
jgi:hypothetical protein